MIERAVAVNDLLLDDAVDGQSAENAQDHDTLGGSRYAVYGHLRDSDDLQGRQGRCNVAAGTACQYRRNERSDYRLIAHRLAPFTELCWGISAPR
jgi:hypothetical protein